MGNDGRDDLVVDVADALTLRRQFEWDRCAGLATPAHRRVLDSLRELGGVFMGRPRRRECMAELAGDELEPGPNVTWLVVATCSRAVALARLATGRARRVRRRRAGN